MCVWGTLNYPGMVLTPQRPFEEFLLGGDKNRDVRLMLWAYEDALKEEYAAYVKIVESFSRDSDTNIKIKCIGKSSLF